MNVLYKHFLALRMCVGVLTGWEKFTKAKSGGQCRLLCTVPAAKKKEGTYTSGLAPVTPPSPTPSQAAGMLGTSTRADLGQRHTAHSRVHLLCA